MNAKPVAFIHPGLFRLPARCCSEGAKTLLAVFVGVFRRHKFPFSEMDFLARKSNALRGLADQMHFDPAIRLVVNGAMAELLQIEICGEFSVGAMQQVQIESSRHSPPVVICRAQDIAILWQIHTNEKSVPRLAPRGKPAQEDGRLTRFEISNG